MVLSMVIFVIILCKAWELYVEEDRALAMEKRILPSMEGRRDGHNHGQNLGGREVRGPGVESVVVHLIGVGGRTQGRIGSS